MSEILGPLQSAIETWNAMDSLTKIAVLSCLGILGTTGGGALLAFLRFYRSNGEFEGPGGP